MKGGKAFQGQCGQFLENLSDFSLIGQGWVSPHHALSLELSISTLTLTYAGALDNGTEGSGCRTLGGGCAQSADSLCTLTLDLGTAFILLLLEPFPLNCEGLSPSTQTQTLRPSGGHQQAVSGWWYRHVDEALGPARTS